MSFQDARTERQEPRSEAAPVIFISAVFILSIAAAIGFAQFQELAWTTHRIDARVLVENGWKPGASRECRTYADHPAEFTCDVGGQAWVQQLPVTLHGTATRTALPYVEWRCKRAERSIECWRADPARPPQPR